MKKLRLLKPDKKRAYLNYGKGQEVNYLFISKDLDQKALMKDIAAGAVQYKECMDFTEKKNSRVVLIDCQSEEEGLMAVSYMAGIFNQKEGAWTDLEDYFEEDCIPDFCSDESEDLEISDFEDEGMFGNIDGEDESDDDQGEWEESPHRIPVITLQELIQYANFGDNIFSENDRFIGGRNRSNERLPYWLSARREPVCIVAHQESFSYGFGGFGNFGIENSLCKELKRFTGNRHVFVLLIREEKSNDILPFSTQSDENPEENSFTNSLQQIVAEVILEYTAGLVTIQCTEKEREKYYQILLENWAQVFGKKLEPRFPKAVVAQQIVAMRSSDKSALMEKVYRYILSEGHEGDILRKEDFAVLKKFRMLGTTVEKKDEQKFVQKLENTLVGMESVKRQVKSIVEVMKYNKKRAQMGLDTGGYHNVHLLIGAPGTAKTTVAQLMGNIMCEQKLLPGNRFISINGADLKGMFVGHSAPKTKRYFDEYDIILIDEAYSITSEHDMDSFSQEAIAQLIIELEKHGMDKLVMFAGYGGIHVKEKDNKMKQFLNANPGIRSRINSTIYFDSYTPEEMVEIVHCQARNQKYLLGTEADELMREYFAQRVKDPDFGNGREARSLLENITVQAASRTMLLPENKLTKKVLQELKSEDVEAALKKQREAYEMQKGQLRKNCGFLQQ